MDAWRYLRLIVLVLASALVACSGSGSSGFDVFPGGENAAISAALQEGRCVSFEGLSICPAGQEEPTAPPTPTATATVPATIATLTPAPTEPTATATPHSPGLATHTPTPTPTATQTPAEGIAIALDAEARFGCEAVDDQTCSFFLSFAPEGFPIDTEYRVATRTVNPNGPWSIGPGLTLADTPGTTTLATPVAVNGAFPIDADVGVQLAVLVFLEPPLSVPEQVEQLADSGADLAYVTSDVTLVAGL